MQFTEQNETHRKQKYNRDNRKIEFHEANIHEEWATKNKGNANAGVQLSLRNQYVTKGARVFSTQLPSTKSIGMPRAKQIAEIL